jgi:hypothetical protein
VPPRPPSLWTRRRSCCVHWLSLAQSALAPQYAADAPHLATLVLLYAAQMLVLFIIQGKNRTAEIKALSLLRGQVYSSIELNDKREIADNAIFPILKLRGALRTSKQGTDDVLLS